MTSKPRLGGVFLGSAVASVTLLLLAALAGESAAEPGLGAAASLTPPVHLGWHWSSATVSVVLAVGYLLGAAAVLAGLLAVRDGWRPRARQVGVTAVVVTALLVCVPPLGSGDHLSYAAYGRIAAAGQDPYLVNPSTWRGGLDPVARAVQPPWATTRSVYGPVATALQAGVSRVAGPSLPLTVWLWSLLVGVCWLVAGWVLDRLTRHDPAARARAVVLWLGNPVLLGVLVLGAHLDVVPAAAGLAAFAVVSGRAAAWRWAVAGALLGVAAGSKLPYAAAGAALAWGAWQARRTLARRGLLTRLAALLVGALLVLVPAHLWAGPHVYDQLRQARKFVSLATPWRPVIDRLDAWLGAGPVRAAVFPVQVVLSVLLLVAMVALVRRWRPVPVDPVVAAASLAAVVLGGAYLLAAPYDLPWYDALLWAPLPLALAPDYFRATKGRAVRWPRALAGQLDAALLVRVAVLALAYVPGRVVGLAPEVERITLGFRRSVAPWLELLALLWILALAWRAGRGRAASPVPLPADRPPEPALPPR